MALKAKANAAARRRREHRVGEPGSSVTGERGNGGMTRHGLEEYITDCVIMLDHRVVEQNATRRLRVVKYRGSTHGANESPFFIDESGISVLPIASLGLQHRVSAGRLSAGLPGLDEMLGGKGYFRGSSILVSGSAGTGKTSIAGYFADAACRRGESALYFAFEESAAQIVRNLRSIGLDLEPWLKKGLLKVHAARPTTSGLEGHLSAMHRLIEEARPEVVVVDPISNLISVGTSIEVKAMLARLIDFMKVKQTTALFTSLTLDESHPEGTDVGIYTALLGSATRETRTAMIELAVRNVLAVLAGQPPLTPVS